MDVPKAKQRKEGAKVLRKNKRAAKYNSGGREDGASDRSASELGDCHHGAKEALAEGVPKDAEDLEDQAFRKAAAKRAHADELLARLSKKFCTTLNGKKKLALQDKMMRLLPKCSPMQPEPKVLGSLPTRTNTARGVTVATSLQSSIRTSHLGTGFPLKLIRTPKAATHVLTEPSSAQEDARLRLRQHRFGDSSAAAAQEGSPKDDVALVESGGYGTSEALEKEYLRLTSLPRAANVRPPAVLAVALKLVKAKWLRQPDYAAASEQLKSIRQDLTVQHVRDSLTVDVYETHGRLALEANDLAEFRRCHGVLRRLYAEEATAATRNTLAMELRLVAPHLLEHSFVRHALEVCAAVRSGNYVRFIALYDGAPRMSPYVMDKLLGQMRLFALKCTTFAYKPLPVPLSYLAAQLGLEAEEEAAELAEAYGAVVDRQERCLVTKASITKES
ncbi:hypothetical protein Vretifemale_10178 [Volvox reticuliferus]|uniref:SAC3/GANP/THP3 conserved domain-containing protein n=1 Tax=Volvox reticuliferus TaxID=1737510 RepID=A0A8J4CIW0_9CHLO|nr:hypothetical protein Vretifemale_10178 [Volvox reticuliferus]